MGGEAFPALDQSFSASGQQMVSCHRLSQDTTGMISLVWWMPPPLPLRFIYEQIQWMDLRFRIQHVPSMRIQLQGFDSKKWNILQLQKNHFFMSKIANIYP
jgi:hypothetical protein